MKRLIAALNELCLRAKAAYDLCPQPLLMKNMLLFIGMGLLTLGTYDFSNAQVEQLTHATPGFDQGLISCAVDSIFQLIEGKFGALVMVVSGLAAIISAAVGAYRASLSMLVVAVGAFILRSLVSLFWGTDFDCQVQME